LGGEKGKENAGRRPNNRGSQGKGRLGRTLLVGGAGKTLRAPREKLGSGPSLKKNTTGGEKGAHARNERPSSAETGTRRRSKTIRWTSTRDPIVTPGCESGVGKGSRNDPRSKNEARGDPHENQHRRRYPEGQNIATKATF